MNYAKVLQSQSLKTFYQSFSFMISPDKLLQLSKRASRINNNSRRNPNYTSRDSSLFSMDADQPKRVFITFDDEDPLKVEEYFKYSRPRDRNERHSVVRSLGQMVPPSPKPRRDVLDMSNTNASIDLLRNIFTETLGACPYILHQSFIDTLKPPSSLIIYTESLDVDATKYGKKSSRVTIKRRANNGRSSKANNKGASDKLSGNKRASYDIIILSKNIITIASNGETNIAEGLAAIRADSNVWNNIISKCKGTVRTFTSWSFADMVGDVRSLARSELELFEVDAILSQDEEWYYVWSTDKGKITAQEATVCTKTNKEINTTHRRKQLCYVTSCDANGRVGMELISSLTPVMNLQVNKRMEDMMDIVDSNSVRIDQVFGLLARFAQSQGVSLTAEEQAILNPIAASTAPSSRHNTLSLPSSNNTSPDKIQPHKSKRQKIRSPVPLFTPPPGQSTNVSKPLPTFKGVKHIPLSLSHPFFDNYVVVLIPGDGNCQLTLLQIMAKLLGEDVPTITNLRQFLHDTVKMIKQSNNNNESVSLQNGSDISDILTSKRWEDVEYLDHLFSFMTETWQFNICLFAGDEFQAAQTGLNIGFTPHWPCLFALWTPHNPSKNQKAHYDAIISLDMLSVIDKRCKIGRRLGRRSSPEEEKESMTENTHKNDRNCAYCSKIIGRSNNNYYLCDYCDKLIHRGCLKNALSNFDDIDDDTKLKCPDCHGNDKLLTKKGRRMWTSIV